MPLTCNKCGKKLKAICHDKTAQMTTMGCLNPDAKMLEGGHTSFKLFDPDGDIHNSYKE